MPSMNQFEPGIRKTDMTLVLDIIGHIEEPCGDKNGENLRESHLRIARGMLQNVKWENPIAEELLRETIRKYDK